MEFYQLVLNGLGIFFVQICLPVWIVGWKIKPPGDDVESRKNYRIKVVVSFMLGAMLATFYVIALCEIFSTP